MDLLRQEPVVARRVQVRRFPCVHCPRRIFAEPIPEPGTQAWRSERLDAAQIDIG